MRALLALAVAASLATRQCIAQPSPTGEIARVWNAYIASKHGQFAANAGARSALWSSGEQDRWPMYDLAGFYLPDGANGEVVSIRPSSGGEYEIVTRFRAPAPDSSSMTLTVFALRENGRWMLANALPRKTASWQRETVGQITFFVEPSLTFSRERARRAVAFVDSVATAFGVPRLGATDYYVASSVDVAMEIMGVKLPVTYGAKGGFSKPVNRQLFSGIPALGENYRHELAHLVLLPLMQSGTLTRLASEGVVTWLGGTEGTDFRGAVRNLSRYLAANPRVTLDGILDARSTPQAVHYTAGAVLCAMLSERAGVTAIKEFLRAGPGPDQLRADLVRLLGAPWATIEKDWRATIGRLGG